MSGLSAPQGKKVFEALNSLNEKRTLRNYKNPFPFAGIPQNQRFFSRLNLNRNDFISNRLTETREFWRTCMVDTALDKGEFRHTAILAQRGFTLERIL